MGKKKVLSVGVGLMGYSFSEEKHMHSFNGKPLIGVTSALDILSKNLTWWSAGLAVGELGWTNPKKVEKNDRIIRAGEMLTHIKLMTIGDYLSLLDKAYRAHSVKKTSSANEGKSMHAMLEEFINLRMIDREPLLIDNKIKPFVDWADKHVKRFLFSELHCFSPSLHVGGIADFGYQDKEDHMVLGDFKSSAAIYWNMFVQTGGYHILISEQGGFDSNGKRILPPMEFDYHAIFAERVGLDKPQFNHDTARVRRAFANCVHLYQERLFWEGDAR